ncbi:MAG: methyltransferase domain-containing protein [Dehalococcoidia bacterium]|nr:methyltransferase domain-containing protein [Dehalococcoidia bacterium]
MTAAHAPRRPQPQQAARLREYDRWLGGNSVSGVFYRWLMGAQGQLLANGPLLRLPEELKLDSTARILDVGCGRGALVRALDEQLQCEVAPAAVDFSRAALRLASADFARAPAGAQPPHLAQSSATALPFRDGAFTLVLCGYVAKHLDDRELRALLLEMHRVIEPGGLGVLWEFGPTGNPRLDAWNARVLASGVQHPRLRSSATLVRHAEAAGFDFVRPADLRPFLVPPIPRASILVGRPPEGWQGPARG